MVEYVDQHEGTIGPDGSIVIPAVFLEKLQWKPGQRILLEDLNDSLLITEIEAPGDIAGA